MENITVSDTGSRLLLEVPCSFTYDKNKQDKIESHIEDLVLGYGLNAIRDLNIESTSSSTVQCEFIAGMTVPDCIDDKIKLSSREKVTMNIKQLCLNWGMALQLFGHYFLFK